MTGRIERRLSELGITLPKPPAPVASYVPTVISGNLIFVSGQVSFVDGKLITGKAGADLDMDRAREAARACAVNTLAQLQSALGDLDRVKRCVKLVGFVNAAPDFTDHPKVINGASDLMVEVFGDSGKHARSAVGAGSLPLNSAVEVESIFEFA
ncbi:MAG: RidA family protein [Alphaproteobacteria bacterium]